MLPFRLVCPYQCDKREVCGSKQDNAYAANCSGREKKPHGPDTEEGNKILLSVSLEVFQNIQRKIQVEDQTLTDQGWHEICQSSRIAAF